MIQPQLENKVALITGSNHGIGAATAQAFVAQGAKVFIAYYRGACPYSEQELKQAQKAGIGGDKLYRALQQQTADSLLRYIRALGGTAAAHEIDLSEPDNIPVLFDLCETQLGPVDILVNNHTHCILETFDPALTTDGGSDIQLLTATGIDAHFAINTRAYALLMSEYLQRYLRRKAQAVVSSTLARTQPRPCGEHQLCRQQARHRIL